MTGLVDLPFSEGKRGRMDLKERGSGEERLLEGGESCWGIIYERRINKKIKEMCQDRE